MCESVCVGRWVDQEGGRVGGKEGGKEGGWVVPVGWGWYKRWGHCFREPQRG